MIADWISSLPLLLVMAAAGWFYAWRRSNVNIVDSLWSLFFLAAALVYTFLSDGMALSSWLLLALVGAWSLRLSIHLAQRNAGKAEDHRYGAMRQRNPRFARQSLVTVFGLQAVLAWIISVPLVAAISTPAEPGAWHIFALLLFATGFYFEAVAEAMDAATAIAGDAQFHGMGYCLGGTLLAAARDGDPDVHPGVEDACGDEADEDCDGFLRVNRADEPRESHAKHRAG